VTRTLPTLLALSLLLTACHRAPREPRFAIEGVAPARVPIDESFGSDSRMPLDSLARSGAASETLAGWETLELHYATEGDRVIVTVFALHSEYDPRRHATIFRSQKLGAHTAEVRGSVRLAELERYGYAPLTLRVVPAK
jgi:hypothetical protein